MTGQRSQGVEHARPPLRRGDALIPSPFEKTGRPVVVPIQVSDPVGSGPGIPLRSSTCSPHPALPGPLVSAGNYVT